MTKSVMKNALFRLVVILLMLSMLVRQGLGQHAPYFSQLSIKQGLSQGIVYSIYQDREGFMWFGTANGLNKYDGYSFQVFQPDPNDPDHSLRNNIIWDILEDKTNQLWVTTMGEGIHQIDKQSGRATAYKTGVSNRDLCYQFCVDRQGDFWIASAAGLNQFNPQTKRFVLWPAPAPGDQEIRSVLEDNRGILWIGTTKGLYQLDRRTRHFQLISLSTTQQNQPNFINALYQDSAGAVWVAAIDKGLYRFDYDASNRHYQVSPRVYLAGHGISPNGISEAAPGSLWVGTHGKGLKQLNTQTGQETTYVYQKDVAGSLSNNSALAVLQIHTGTLWVGTDRGINISSPQARKFDVFQIEADPTFSRQIANNISALYEDRQGIIWVGNEWYVHTDGLLRIDRRQHTRQLYQHHPGQKNSLLSNHVTALLEDHTGLLWVGTLEGVQSLNRSTGLFTRYPTAIKVRTIQEDKEGNLWLGGSGGIARLDRQTGQLTYVWTNEYNKVNKLLLSKSGMIWVATSGQGLGQIDPQTRTYAPVQVGNGRPLSNTIERLSDWTILSMFEDSQGILWLGTSQGGMNRFDPRKNECRVITTRQGLPSNNIAGILGDDRGNLWLATNRGLCRYNPVTGHCRKFDERDGLPDNEFHPTYCRSATGELLFGGPNGFAVYRPDQLRDNSIPPVVYITGVHIFEQVRPRPAGRIDLAYDENFLQFDFVGLSYVLPEKNRYVYQLEGVDRHWIASGTRRVAPYTDLSPGSYVFRVKAANNDGVWSVRGDTLTVVIHPPWWRTWWAYAVYAVLSLLLIWGFVAYRSRALLRKNHQLEEKVAHRTQQVLAQQEEIKAQRDSLAHTLTELQTTQNQLIQSEKMASLGELTAGIAHEIQNPLNFVTNFSELSVDLLAELQEGPIADLPDDKKSYADEIITDLNNNLKKISHHGQRASSIVRGMLEHSQSYTGEKRSVDLNKLVDESLRLAYHGMRAKDSTFNCLLITHFDRTLEPVSVVPQEMNRVLVNLLNNAFYAVQQATSSEPAHKPEVRISTYNKGNRVDISVEDNGIGMPESIKQKIFQPFFTTKPTGQGTGLGLSLSYDSITKGHGGTLTVRSQEGHGAVFVISIPA